MNIKRMLMQLVEVFLALVTLALTVLSAMFDF